MTAGLAAAIDGLYVAFAAYANRPPPPYGMAADPVGFAAHLAAKPLRELSPTDLETFTWKAMTSWGDVDDFRHYLPRLLELAAGEMSLYGSPEMPFCKLAYGQWRTWPADQVGAVEAFCGAWWRAVVGRPTDRPFAEMWAEPGLGCLAQAFRDVRPFLADWRSDQSAAAAIHLAKFLHYLVDGEPLGQMWWSAVELYGESIEQSRQVFEWATSPDRAVELEAAFFTFAFDDEAAAEVSGAVDLLAYVKVPVDER